MVHIDDPGIAKRSQQEALDATFAWSKLCRIVLFVWVGGEGRR